MNRYSTTYGPIIVLAMGAAIGVWELVKWIW